MQSLVDWLCVLGVLDSCNKATLAKWILRFLLEPNSLWCRTIGSKHGPRPFEWLNKGVKGTYCNLWKDV